MEKLFGLFILIATALFVNGDRLAGLEKKVVGMEMSFHQDIVMLRNSIQSINEKLDIVLNLNMPVLQQEFDEPTSTSDDNVRPEQIPLNTQFMQTEIKRFRRAFTALKHDFKSSVELEQNKLTNSVTYTRDKIDQTLQKVTDKVLAMTSDIHFNVVTFINETNNRTLSLVETSTNERRALSDEIKNELISFKTNQGLEQNKTFQEFTDNVRTMITDISFNISTFINEANNRTLSLVETATNERLALVKDIKNITKKFDATEHYTVRNYELNKDILSSVQSLKVNQLISFLLDGDLSKQYKHSLYKHLDLIYRTCSDKVNTCREINTFPIPYVDIITYLIKKQDTVRLGDYTIDKASNTVKGRVEVYYNNEWGTVCDDLFGESNTGAEVVCRQLGLTDGTPIKIFGSGVGQIWLDDVKCTGTESNIFQCPRDGYTPIGEHNCNHSEDVGVVCTIPDDLKSLYQD